MNLSSIKREAFRAATNIRSSYWFIPSVMAICSVLLVFVMIAIDGIFDSKFYESFEWAISTDVKGTRSILSLVTSSIISVAGVLFSLSFIAVSHASANIGQRVLVGFMNNRGNQVSLGIFISTFVYGLILLKAIDSPKDGSVPAIPHLSVIVAMVLCLISVFTIIYFIHHISRTISIREVLRKIGAELNCSIERRFPSSVGREGDRKEESFNYRQNAQYEIESRAEGYLQSLNTNLLMKLAKKHELVMEALVSPGEYIIKGQSIIRLYGGSGFDRNQLDQLKNCFIIGVNQTYDQNVLFGADLLVDVALKALSPGINDPRTACDCLNRLFSAFAQFRSQVHPSSYRMDDQWQLRLIFPVLDFEAFYIRVMDQLRSHVAQEFIVTRQCFELGLKLKSIEAFSEEEKFYVNKYEQLWKVYRQVEKDEDHKAEINHLWNKIEGKP